MDSGYRQRVLPTVERSGWWFGVNNRSRGHMQLSRLLPFLRDNQTELVWPLGHSKPRKLYAEMRAGDAVLFWTGRGRARNWGLIGTARILKVTEQQVVPHRPTLFPTPVTPYPKDAIGRTDTVDFLLDTFGVDFPPLGDVKSATLGGKRPPPMTVAHLPTGALNAVLARAIAP